MNVEMNANICDNKNGSKMAIFEMKEMSYFVMIGKVSLPTSSAAGGSSRLLFFRILWKNKLLKAIVTLFLTKYTVSIQWSPKSLWISEDQYGKLWKGVYMVVEIVWFHWFVLLSILRFPVLPLSTLNSDIKNLIFSI